jgi:lipopolysaccharide/colanic/teichoic acid biosynthesis glycosyltransferase
MTEHLYISELSKRAFDIAGALIGTIALSPVIVIIILVLRIRHGNGILFTQIRPGLSGKPFKIYKFKTMTEKRDASGELLPDAERLTSLGRFLRATSLDELPELLNILKGEMSIVGPRPLLMQYLSRYTPEQARRNEVKPGLTGWAQINGRNALSWEEKFNLDVWYIDHRTLRLDIKIILLTIKKVLLREGISHPGEATMTEFRG